MSATPRVTHRPGTLRRLLALAALALILELGLPAAARADGGTLDVATLRVRLKDTPAIGLVAKLRLKSQFEDLLGDLAAVHAGRGAETLDALHARYRGLVIRVVDLLVHKDASLASDLTASSDTLWATLADSGRFASLANG